MLRLLHAAVLVQHAFRLRQMRLAENSCAVPRPIRLSKKLRRVFRALHVPQPPTDNSDPTFPPISRPATPTPRTVEREKTHDVLNQCDAEHPAPIPIVAHRLATRVARPVQRRGRRERSARTYASAMFTSRQTASCHVRIEAAAEPQIRWGRWRPCGMQ